MFVLAYEGGDNWVTANSHRRYFLPRVEIKNYNIETDGRNFYDQPINTKETNDLIRRIMSWEKYQQDKMMIPQLAVC